MASTTNPTGQHIALNFASVKCFLMVCAIKVISSLLFDLIATLAAPQRGGYGRLD